MEDGGPGQMMLPGPPSPNKDQRPGKGEEGSPFFLFWDREAFSSYIWLGRASSSPTSSTPPHLKCEGIRICNVGLQKGAGGGALCSGL